MSQREDKREIYQQQLEMELLTERRMGEGEWVKQARDAAKAYGRRQSSDPFAEEVVFGRLRYEIFSIAEARRATKEGWML